MKVFKNINDWINFRKELGPEPLGFVPTMGALHKGHLSLVNTSQNENSKTLVSIFLNPTQFNDKNDLKSYPADLDYDIEQLSSVNTDYLLLPTAEQLYPDDYSFQVHEKPLSQILCGQRRPGHFTGVMTVVLKLLNIAKADRAYFGEKDYQQLQIVKKMTEAFFIDTKIVSVPTLREENGLALSSRNKNLRPEELNKASKLFRTISSGKKIPYIQEQLEQMGFKVDYLEEFQGRLYVAAYLGSVRLIDNVSR